MSLNDILTRFSNLSCSTREPQPHVLNFEFPVGSLLADGRHLYLEPPKDVAHRCEPPEDYRFSGIPDLDFSIVLKADASAPTPSTAAHQVLLRAISDLASLEGSSVLGVASYLRGTRNHQVVYLYQLTTRTNSGFSSSRSFKLDANESCLLLDFAKTHEWVSILQGLVSRSSDKAYYHVRKQLTDQYDDAFGEELRWEVSWSAYQRSSFKDAFLHRSVSMFPESATGERNAVRLTLHCGHILNTTTSKLAQMTEQDYRSAKCPKCKVRVLSSTQIHEVEVAKESIRCNKQHEKNEHWVALDHDPIGHARNFDGKALAAAIRAALKSFTVSPLISPPALCSAGSQYTRSIMEHFESFFSGDGLQLHHQPEALVQHLMHDALEVATNTDGEALSFAFVPPAYIKFLHAWICRAVNFLCERQCNEMQTSHLGVHRHGQVLVYNPALWEPDAQAAQALDSGDGRDDDLDAMVDTLDAEMADMDLEGRFAFDGLLESMEVEVEQGEATFEEEL